jgi:uncharacterized protein
MTREEAYKLLTDNVKNPNLIKHMLAAETTMRTLYVRLNPNPNTQALEEWGLVGLLHDLDYELAKDHPEKHGLLSKDKLYGKIDDSLIYAIMAHNAKYTKIEPKSPLDWSIYCCDELTGFIVACALVHPDKKLASIDLNFVLNRFKQNSFARGASREKIKMCEEKLGIELNEFIQITLSAMQTIAPELGL